MTLTAMPAARAEPEACTVECPRLWCGFIARGSTTEQARFFLHEHELMEHTTD